MTLDERLIKEVDRAVKRLKTTRSAFTRYALRNALKQQVLRNQEEQHRRGYEKFPDHEDDFSDWEDEQVWPK